MKTFARLSVLLTLVFSSTPHITAEVRLASIFADHMVLQCDRPIHVWGWADKGEQITVAVVEQSAKATAGQDETWSVTLTPLAASTEGQDLHVRSADQKIAVHDVVVGDVWHASGQSNMAMTVGSMARVLAKEYGKQIAFSGPVFERQEIHSGKVVVYFKYAGSGLMVATKDGLSAPHEAPDDELAHFELADETGAWQPAKAVIDGKTVDVTCERTPRPVAVRYAYSASPEDCNLYNRVGLPASPFCSKPGLLEYDPELPR